MPPKTGCLLVRAEGDARIGAGHVMRCLALAQAWQDQGGRALFAMRDAPAGLRSRLESENIEVHEVAGADDPAATLALARHNSAAWIVLDGYSFGVEYQERVHDAGFRLLAVDDYGHAQRYVADLVLNQNIHASEETYRSRAAHTRLLLGTRYALLRREFRRHRDFRRQTSPQVARIMVTLGGADPDNVTGLVIEALRGLPGDPQVKVVVGPINPHREALQRAAASTRIELVEVPDMPELMAWADMAVTAAGSTTWELLFMQLPLVAIAVADNQLPSARWMRDIGLAETLVFSAKMSPQQIREPLLRLMQSAGERRRLAAMGRELVDGGGSQRVLNHLVCSEVFLRPVRSDDRELLWRWANDPTVRSVSFHSDPIPWEDHVRWFARKIADPACVFYVAGDRQSRPIGQVRFDLEKDRATISLSIDGAFRGQGYGYKVLWAACREFFAATLRPPVHAWVREGNEASLRLFWQAGFSERSREVVRGVPAVHLVLEERDFLQ